ncbi:energy transducer TonB [Flagellimonas algicola]|uniref:Energy transducer TonB n=1 Tax=Flagellimonas algicola TaxID=2583815 RepID=A0ABY2WHP1_9FLAO|nr:energy transducer TonB [Allomuricauda algicola]TMU50978.1 energy transducer TonB [Allomuricauda algicola]
MEPKKNQELDLKRNSLLYFSIGLAAVLLLAYVALEWKSFHKTPYEDIAHLKLEDDLRENAPITIQKLPPPPPPKIHTPPVIEIIDDDDDKTETFIESIEPNHTTEVASIGEIEVAKEEEPEIVPWKTVEEAPMFPGCENATDHRVCFQEMIQKHIRKNFRYPKSAQEMGLQGRVNVVFTIQKDGSIGDVRMRGPHKILETEASRIISKLPKMSPGKQRGTPVKVPFSIPITFRLN